MIKFFKICHIMQTDHDFSIKYSFVLYISSKFPTF